MKNKYPLKSKMSFSRILSFLLLNILSLSLLHAQTGPGGVGLKENVIVWLKASDGVTYNASNEVSSWADQSIFGHLATQSVASLRPTYVADGGAALNNNPVIRFNNHSLSIPDNDDLDGFTEGVSIFVVLKATAGNGFQGVIAKSSAFASFSAYNMYIRDDGDLRMLINNFGADAQSPGTGTIGASTYILSGVYDPIVKQNLAIYTNSSSSATDSPVNGMVGYYPSALNIGSYSPGSSTENLHGDIAEIIIYNKGLKNAERLILENYLSEKYGIAVSKDIFGADPDYTSAYFTDYTGIGGEADGYTASSNSAGFYISENSNTLSGGEYITFAHNNTANTVVTTNLAGSADARWARDWWVEKSTGANVNTTLTFDIQEGFPGGRYPQNISNYVLLYRSANTGNYTVVNAAASIGDVDQVVFDVINAGLQNGYYTLGTTNQADSPVEGQAGVTWYSLISGDWNSAETWTLDPSGALPNNPGGTYPQDITDNVVIKDGKTVTMNLNNLHCATLEVDGRLDLVTTSGHTFDKITGSGRILMAADNFPAFTDNSGFVGLGRDEGTVVYYGNNYSLNKNYTFYNMEVNMTAGQTLTLLNDYTLNGNLTVINGALRMNDNSAVKRTLSVNNNVTVNAGATIRTGPGNTLPGYHRLIIKGDFTNNGTALFTNRTAPGYTAVDSGGAVEVIFNNVSKNQTVLCNGETRFNQLTCDKGSDDTYILDVSAGQVNNFKLFGRNNHNVLGNDDIGGNRDGDKALRLLAGTLKLGNNIVIPELSYGDSYDIDTDARLWLYANATVTIDEANYLAVYGTLQCSDNSVFNEITYAGTVLRGRSTLKFEGGTHNLNAVRTSTWGGAGNHLGAYIQSGGTVNVVNEGGSYASFHLPFQSNVFQMSGGTLRITDQGNQGSGDDFAMIVNSSEANSDVTGGTVIIDAAQNVGASYLINLRAPVWNLILRNSHSTTFPIEISAHTATNNDTETMSAMPLHVLNDLTIEGTNGTTFNTNDADVRIGRNFRIEEGATYNFGNNTTAFNGSENGELYIGHSTANDGYEQHFHNFVVNKPADKTLLLTGDIQKTAQYQQDNSLPDRQSGLVHVENKLVIKSGTLNQGEHSIRLFGSLSVRKNGQCGVYETGVTHLYAMIMLNAGDIETEKGAMFGNIKMNPSSSGTVSFSSDVYMKRISYFTGRINIGAHNLKVDYLHDGLTTDNYAWDAGNAASKMIYSDGKASDGGLSMLITGNGTYGFPIGVSGKYTPAKLLVTNFTDEGYITVNPADEELKTSKSGGGEILSYYWPVNHEGFTALPTVQWRFKYDDVDATANENTYYPGKVLDEDPYTRSYEDFQANVSTGNNEIFFTDYKTTIGNVTVSDTRTGFTLEKANYTAGAVGRFTGTVEQFFTNARYEQWNDETIWHRGSKTGPTGTVPTQGSIVHIYSDGSSQARIWVNAITNVPAEVIFELNRTAFPVVDQENIPRLQFYNPGTYQLGKVSGTGMVSLYNTAQQLTVNADWGEFANNIDAIVMYWGGNATLNNIIQPVPSLMLEGYNIFIDQNVVINANLILNGAVVCTPLQDIEVKGNLYVGSWSDGQLKFPSSGSPLTLTVGGNVDFTYMNEGKKRNILVSESGDDITHKLIVKGNIIHGSNSDYRIDLYSGVNRPKVELELQGDGNMSYSRTSSSVPQLYRLITNKGNSTASSFTFNKSIVLSGSTSGAGVSKAVELQNGLLVLNNAGININLTTGDDYFAVPSTAGLEVRAGTVNAVGNSGIALDGLLKISGGTLNMLGGDNPISYSSSGHAAIDVSSGNLYVGSQIRRNETTGEGVLKYTQSGGVVEVGRDAAGIDSRGIFEVLNPGSSYTHTGGSFTLANDLRTNPVIGSIYFDPETVSLGAGTGFVIGNANTSYAGKDFTLYGGKAIQNLTIDNVGTNNPTVTSSVVPLFINEHLTIGSGTVFDANGLDLTIKGNYTNAGTFTSNGNNTYFSGAANQTLSSSGTGNFYNLFKDTGNTLTLTNDITVERESHLTNGVFNDGGYNLFAKGDMYIDINTLHTAGGAGIVACGTAQQLLTGSPVLASLKIDNIEGVKVPVGNQIAISGQLILNKGIFDVDQNLLVIEKNASITEASSFSERNMIQTNISFTDAGIKKVYPAIASSTNFIYPIGSQGKYTPVTLSINTINDGASIRVKAADEHQPTVQNGLGAMGSGEVSNVLQYYWILDAEGASGVSATAVMQAYHEDELVTSPNTTSDYITARLRNRASGVWEKYGSASNNDYNENAHQLTFTLTGESEQIDGDYTGGIDEAIPNHVAQYVSQNNGNWSSAATWLPNIAGGPRGARVLVKHEVTMDGNYNVSYETGIDNSGKLKINQSYGHRLGNVYGTGTLYLERGDMPAGEYAGFFAPDSGKVEYGYSAALNGDEDYDILSSTPSVNTVVVSGAGTRRLPNIELQLHGDLIIGDMTAGPQLINEHGQKLNIKKNLEFNNGIYTSKTDANCIINFNGAATQLIKGSKGFTAANASSLFNVEINNSNGVTLNNDIEIAGGLTFGSGIINSSAAHSVTITNTADDCVLGATNLKYVNGPLFKSILSGDEFNFPVGKAARFGNIQVKGASHNGIWEAEYYNNSAGNAGYDVTKMKGDVEFVSRNEYWRVKAPASGNSANLRLRWDNSSGVSPDDNLRVVRWTKDITADTWSEVAVGNKTGNAGAGTVALAAPLNFGFSSLDNNHYVTFGYISIPQFTWLGNDNDWFKTSNWQGGVLPGAGVDIIVNNAGVAPVINTSSLAQVHNLTINHTNGLTLSPGAQMTINGNLTTNNKFFINNTNAEPASLITHGTVTGDVAIQWAYDEMRWWFIGHGIANPQMDAYRTIRISDPTNKFVMYDYENSGKLVKISHNSLYNFAANDELRGYQFKVLKPGTTVRHIGTLNALSSYAKPVQTGWQIIANPYPCYYQLPKEPDGTGDFAATTGSVYVTVSTTNQDKVFETFNTGSGITSPEDFNGIIAPSQAFYVKTDSRASNAVIKMSAANRVHDTQKVSLKSAQPSHDNILRIKLSNEYNVTDEAVIALRPGGDVAMTRMDSEQRYYTDTNLSYIYSVVDGVKAVINVLPEKLFHYQQPLGMQLRKGKQTIKIEGIKQLKGGYDVVLEDKVSGISTPMDSHSIYEFTSEAGTFDNRFMLHFSKKPVTTNIRETDAGESNGVSVYIRDNSILQVTCNWDEKDKTVKVFTVSGHLVLNEVFKGKTFTNNLSLKTGVYIVKVTGADKTHRQKVFVR